MNIKKRWYTLVSGLLTTLATRVAWSDVALELPPPLETDLPLPRHIVLAGLAFSVVLVLVGLRLIRREKFNRVALNVLLFLVGAATASLAFYSNKIRADYAADVERVREANRRGGRGAPPPNPDELKPAPVIDDGRDPPAIDPPDIDLPEID